MATFGGITFDWLLPGFAQERTALATVRTPPGGLVHYVDLAGRGPDRWRVDVRCATLADFENLQNAVGSYTTLTYATGEPDCLAVLHALTRYWRRGTGPQLAHSEWTVFPT